MKTFRKFYRNDTTAVNFVDVNLNFDPSITYKTAKVFYYTKIGEIQVIAKIDSINISGLLLIYDGKRSQTVYSLSQNTVNEINNGKKNLTNNDIFKLDSYSGYGMTVEFDCKTNFNSIYTYNDKQIILSGVFYKKSMNFSIREIKIGLSPDYISTIITIFYDDYLKHY